MGDLAKGADRVTVEIDGHQVTYRDGNHTYLVRRPDGSTVRPPSASTITKTLDIGKTNALMWWASGRAAESMRESLVKLSNDGVVSFEAGLIGALVEKARKAHNERTEEAAQVGRDLHEEIEDWIEGTSDAAELGHGALEFVRWAEGAKLDRDGAQCERIIYHPGLDYAGTFDLLAEATIHGKRGWWLLDFKTSNALRREYDLQVAAYASAAPLRYPGIDLVGAAILKVPKAPEDGGIEVRVLDGDDFQEAFETFEAARRIYQWGFKR
jgi:hypothetical protein